MRRTMCSLVAAVLSLVSSAALAGTIVVTHFDDVIDDDDGTCTLREAVRSANAAAPVDGCTIAGPAGDDVIELTAGTYTVDLANGTSEDASADGDIDIAASLEVRGIAPEYTVIDGDSETAQERVFDIRPNVEVTIRGVTITGGHEPAGNGGNVRNEAAGSTGMGGAPGLTLRDVVISGGRAQRGGGIDAGGGIAILRSVVRDNEALDDNGGGGGVAFGGQNLDVVDSEIVNNRAPVGGGLYGFGGGIWTIAGSRVAANVAVAGAGAQSGRGGGIASTVGAVTVTRTLIEGNEAESGGGLWLGVNLDTVSHSAIVGNTASSAGGGVLSTADNFVRHTTIAGNEAETGGGAYAGSPTQFLLDAVTLAGNTGGGLFNDSGARFEASILADNAGGNCTGNEPPGAGVYNLDDGDSCGFPTDDPDLPGFVNTDPMLGPLQDNGGGLPTFALLDGSPALDAVSSAVRTNCQGTPDQRGYPRGWPPVLEAGQDPEFLCDIGAFERHAAYVVETTADTVDATHEDGVCADANGECSLRAAIMQANSVPGFEEIELAADTYSITLAGAGEDDEIDDFRVADVVHIRGQGAGQTFIDAAQIDRAFHLVESLKAGTELMPAASLFSDLTIRQGAADEGGGGILAEHPLRLERIVLRDNGTGTGNGGALLCADGCDLWVVDSTLAANTADGGHGGAIFHVGGGVLHVERSTLSGNSAGIGGAIETGGLLRARNTTFSGNTAGSSAAFFATRGVIESSTIFDNAVTGDTGGIFLLDPSVIHNSIVAGNRVDDVPDNCSFNQRGIVSEGFNLSDTGSADCNFTHAQDLVDTDARPEQLADNDADVQTHALPADSPAVDAGDDDRCLAMDQRGLVRPADGDDDGTAACDIGAFERQPESSDDGGDDGGDDNSGDGGSSGNGGSSGGGASGWLGLVGLLLLCWRRIPGLLVAAMLLGINGCGGGSGGSSRDAPPPAPKSSTWDEMDWDEGRWD